MPQIEKPLAGGSAEGFDELNSIIDAAKYTIILRNCGQRIKPPLLFFITFNGATYGSGSLVHLSLASAEGRQR